MKTKRIRLILGDQLNYQHSWFRQVDESKLYLKQELKQETDYDQQTIKEARA